MPVIRDVTRRLDAALLVYDWADDASAHVLTRSGAHRRRLAGWEDEMAAAADVTFLSSAELMRRRGAVCRHAVLMPHGAPVVPADAEPPPAQRREHLGKPRIGFVGSITEFTDLPLVEGLARARPDWSFVLVGPARVSVKALASLPNVTLVGAVPHPEVLALLPSLDAAIIPYHVTPATEAASPVKVHEYLAFGLPVVSVDIPEVRDLEPGVAVATGTEGFLAALDDAVCRGRQPPATGGQRASWAEQVETMAAHVTLALEASHARI
jgi:glycosyltransferase involved in cell wall biosynthesis